MSNKTSSKSQCKADSEANPSKFTTVKTAYARCAMILLALNMLLTGYIVTRLSETSNAAQETGATQSTQTTKTTTASSTEMTPASSANSDQQEATQPVESNE